MRKRHTKERPGAKGPCPRKGRPRLMIALCGTVIALMAVLAAYPLISNAICQRQQSLVICAYEAQVQVYDDTDLREMLAQAQAYNAALVPVRAEGGQFTEAQLQAASDSYYDLLDLDGYGMMGYLDIPSIQVYMPIYHGTGEVALANAVGHVMGTSLPVGGPSTHAVLSAHSGLSSRRLFSDLDALAPGDLFFIHIADLVLAYEVREISIILPEEVEALGIETGEDKVTLVTCWPFAVNTHRLCVTGYRTDYVPEEEAQALDEAGDGHTPFHRWMWEYLKGLLLGVLGFLLVAGTVAIVFRLRGRKGKGPSWRGPGPGKRRRTKERREGPGPGREGGGNI